MRINNRLRRVIEAALGSLTLLAPDPTKRLEAAQAVFKSRDANALAALDQAIAGETDARVRQALIRPGPRWSFIATMHPMPGRSTQ